MYSGKSPRFGFSLKCMYKTFPTALLNNPHCGWKFLPRMQTLASIQSSAGLALSSFLNRFFLEFDPENLGLSTANGFSSVSSTQT